ncbi:hypothetical protein Nepgr_008461 [Nepenthes gracilis]|uniref:Uncharacterized protein n=1 Tax=Nepenthes gracilis TaxID=150966 RepID=A0AAD3S9T4_NEPGR|nr:hypothetical protein Nepgr_008461 [Nepenthes gracilis]
MFANEARSKRKTIDGSWKGVDELQVLRRKTTLLSLEISQNNLLGEMEWTRSQMFRSDDVRKRSEIQRKTIDGSWKGVDELQVLRRKTTLLSLEISQNNLVRREASAI